ncbi:CDP-glycerol glycerophosphotransferase family protein [Neisseria elongata]|uniref:CDP-glycerol glycerophosphotransferase family protein n=1 Tax=Neisseria elongata TaxID=495 RepID=UPI000664E586|nr:CDP-glycerol glycerophosphotransferase family protein [Neisseria elongata]
MKNLKNIINHIFAPSSYRQGLNLYNNKNWYQAMNAFDQAIKEKPTHPQSNFKLGLCHMKLGNLAEAHQYIQEALKLAPYNNQWEKQLQQSQRKLEQSYNTPGNAPAHPPPSVNLNSLPPRITQGNTAKLIDISIKKKLLLIPSDYNHRALADILPFVSYYSNDFDIYIILREIKHDIEKQQGYTLIKNGTSYGEFLKFTADYVLDAGSMNFGYRISDEPTWVSVWHGIPYKKMFVDLDVKHLPGAIRYDLAYDSMISMSNFYTETFLRGAMRYDGTIHQVGSAKIDKLLTTPKDISIRRALGIPPECKIILYAPETRAKGDFYLPFDASKLLANFSDDYRLLVWLDDSFTLANTDNQPNNKIIVTNNLDRVQAVIISDLLISDYRSRLIEMFSNCGKPVILYQYDYNNFSAIHPNRTEELENLTKFPYSCTREYQLNHLNWSDILNTVRNTPPEATTVSVLLKQSLGISLNKKVVLYAPTFRERGAVTLPFDPDKLLDALNGKFDTPPEFDEDGNELPKYESDYVILTKLHYLNTLKTQHPAIIDCTEYGEITDLMKISDILISDYSSLILDFALLNKPIVLFQYDYFQYTHSRGVYFDFEDYLPAKQIIDREIDLYRMDWSNLDGNNQKIIETFYPLEDGNSTRRIVETIAFDSSLRHTKDIIFLVNDLNQIGGVHTFVHNMAKYYKKKYNSRIYLLAIKEFAEHNSEFHVFDSPYVDFKISSQYLKGGCANILQNTDGIVISLQFSAHLHFQQYLYGAKSILMFHGDVKDMISGELYAPHLGWLNNGDLFNYNKLLLLTESNLEVLAPHLHESVRSKLGFMHNSIDAVYAPLPKLETNEIAIISRLDTDKNIFAAVDLAKAIRETQQHIIINIYGDGELKDELQYQIDDNGLNEYIHLHGYEPNKENIFSKNKALVMVSKSEGLSLVALEAYSYGRPIIAFNTFTSAVDTIQHGKTGYLVEPWDFEQMIDYINRTEELDQESIAALFKNFSNDTVFTEWNKLFHEIDEETCPQDKEN